MAFMLVKQGGQNQGRDSKKNHKDLIFASGLFLLSFLYTNARRMEIKFFQTLKIFSMKDSQEQLTIGHI